LQGVLPVPRNETLRLCVRLQPINSLLQFVEAGRDQIRPRFRAAPEDDERVRRRALMIDISDRAVHRNSGANGMSSSNGAALVGMAVPGSIVCFTIASAALLPTGAAFGFRSRRNGKIASTKTVREILPL
jgi:hypothetical protein